MGCHWSILPGTAERSTWEGLVDNFYLSPALFYEAKTNCSVYLIGTLRTDRGVHPGVILKASKLTLNTHKGT